MQRLMAWIGRHALVAVLIPLAWRHKGRIARGIGALARRGRGSRQGDGPKA